MENNNSNSSSRYYNLSIVATFMTKETETHTNLTVGEEGALRRRFKADPDLIMFCTWNGEPYASHPIIQGTRNKNLE